MEKPARREMSFGAVVAMVVGLQLGSGMFLLPRQLIGYGGWGLAGWAVSGLGALALCFIFSLLANSLPQAGGGGPHSYVREVFGQRAAFYVGWSYWTISWLSSVPVLALALSAAQDVLGWQDAGLGVRMTLAGGLCGALLALNLRGAALSGWGEIILTTLKAVPIIVIPILTCGAWRWDVVTMPAQDASAWQALGASSVLTFWGFVGLEAGTTISSYVRHPRVTVPRALFWGTSIVLVIYVVNTVGLMSVLPRSFLQGSDNPYGAVLARLGGPVWGHMASKLVSALVCIVCVGTLNSWTLASGNVAMTAADEGLFPPALAHRNRWGSPRNGLLVSIGLMFVGMVAMQNSAFADYMKVLITLSTLAFLMIYGVTAMALIALVRRGRVAVTGWLVAALVVSCGFCVAALVSSWQESLGALTIPLVGAVLARALRWPVR